VIVWLKLFIFIISICIYYYYIAVDNLYHEAFFIEIVKVFFLDRVFCTYIGHQLELYIQYNRIFAESSLEIVYTRKTCFELEAISSEVVGPLFAHRCYTMYYTKKIGYALYHIEPGRKSSRI